ncbi:MAG: hypothetical protein KKC14_03765 [Alphaproteobacteria bacterium]|nr:hypothetical protein [Alphaproteobacteria bacterium]
MSKPKPFSPVVQDGSPLRRHDAEVTTARHAAEAEMLRRLRFQVLQRALDVLDTLDAVPDGDWRGRLAAVEGLGRAAADEDDFEAEEKDQD